MMRARLAKIVVVAALIPILLPADKTLAEQFTLFAPGEDVSSVNALSRTLSRDEPNSVQVAGTLREALDSESKVLVLFLSRTHYMRLHRQLSPNNITELREKKIIGIGYGAAKLFGTLGLEIKGGKCAHDTRDKQPRIHIQPNELCPENSYVKVSRLAIASLVLGNLSAFTFAITTVQLSSQLQALRH